ncbi:MAG: hypothetical protein VXX37_02095, partial [Pseudomonadota bacterium]|nr:hypothetical protein [Pseudomonadota bacterium]
GPLSSADTLGLKKLEIEILQPRKEASAVFQRHIQSGSLHNRIEDRSRRSPSHLSRLLCVTECQYL